MEPAELELDDFAVDEELDFELEFEFELELELELEFELALVLVLDELLEPDDALELELIVISDRLLGMAYEADLLEDGSSPPSTTTSARRNATTAKMIRRAAGTDKLDSLLEARVGGLEAPDDGLEAPGGGGEAPLPLPADLAPGSTGAPHTAQKLSSSRNCLPQFEQNIAAPFA